MGPRVRSPCTIYLHDLENRKVPHVCDLAAKSAGPRHRTLGPVKINRSPDIYRSVLPSAEFAARGAVGQSAIHTKDILEQCWENTKIVSLGVSQSMYGVHAPALQTVQNLMFGKTSAERSDKGWISKLTKLARMFSVPTDPLGCS